MLAGVNRCIDHMCSCLGEGNLKSLIKLPTFVCENFLKHVVSTSVVLGLLVELKFCIRWFSSSFDGISESGHRVAVLQELNISKQFIERTASFGFRLET